MLVWILRTIAKSTHFYINQDCNNVGKGLKNGKLSKPWMEVISKHNAGGKISALARGVMFVGASIASYAAGQKIGDDVYSRISAAFGGKTENINLKS